MQLSIVVPVYNSADCVPDLARRIQQDVGRHFESYELLLVNDDSSDASWDGIARLTDEYPFITGINLRRNVGQDNAIMAGLHYARGEVVVIMDDDLQHDPSDIPSLYKEIQKGYDVVYANFKKKEQVLWKNFGSWFNDRAAVWVLGKPKHIYMSPYKAIRGEVVEEIIKYEGPYSYVDGLIFTITSNMSQILVTHHTRFAGVSNYNLLKSIRVWLKLATGFSVFPLRIATVTGGIMSLLSFIVATLFVIQALLLERMPEGWPSLIVSVFFLGGIQLMGIGTVGEYIGRIFITQNKRPQFTVKEVRRSIGTFESQHAGDSVPKDMLELGKARLTETRESESFRKLERL
jgi:undecaprenyl-phosphate 4-deoxy-4-formamido-L-arabinose transferase